jgi:hypothetical protein
VARSLQSCGGHPWIDDFEQKGLPTQNDGQLLPEIGSGLLEVWKSVVSCSCNFQILSINQVLFFKSLVRG